jgi:hypothetical protein
MMGTGHEFGQPVLEESSGLRRIRRWRLLLAHDATASTCAPLIDAIGLALGSVDINESSSIDDARVALHTANEGGLSHDGASVGDPRPKRASTVGPPVEPCFDLAMVCLDLPPAPLGGVRLAQEFVRAGLPVVLVTRSLRWIPASAVALRDLPWVTPDATAAEVAYAVAEALTDGAEGHMARAPSESRPRMTPSYAD